MALPAFPETKACAIDSYIQTCVDAQDSVPVAMTLDVLFWGPWRYVLITKNK